MATVTYYMNAYSGAGTWNAPANGVNGLTTALNDTHLNAYESTSAAWYNFSGNTSVGTSLGNITKVELRIYWGYTANYLCTRCYFNIYPEFGGTTQSTSITMFDVNGYGAFSEAWSSYYDITSYASHPSWGTDWGDIEDLDVNMYGFQDADDAVGASTSTRVYRVDIRVTYTEHVASTLVWSTPSADAYSYRGQTLSISGTAANTVAGVQEVQYKIDSGAWVSCTGTTSWSATIAAATLNALSVGSHTLGTRVQRNGDDAWTTTGSRAFVISPLPSQMI